MYNYTVLAYFLLYVPLLSAKYSLLIKVVPPRISPVQEDETQPIRAQYSGHMITLSQSEDETQPLAGYGCSPRSSRSVASPYGEFLGSLGSSSSSLLEDGHSGNSQSEPIIALTDQSQAAATTPPALATTPRPRATAS